MPDFNQLLEDADDQVFEKILNNPHHTLYQLLPPQSAASQNYNLRPRTHDRQLHEHQGHLSDCNFITRLLYKNSYSVYVNYCTDCIIYLYMLCNFICGLSDSQTVVTDVCSVCLSVTQLNSAVRAGAVSAGHLVQPLPNLFGLLLAVQLVSGTGISFGMSAAYSGCSEQLS